MLRRASEDRVRFADMRRASQAEARDSGPLARRPCVFVDITLRPIGLIGSPARSCWCSYVRIVFIFYHTECRCRESPSCVKPFAPAWFTVTAPSPRPHPRPFSLETDRASGRGMPSTPKVTGLRVYAQAVERFANVSVRSFWTDAANSAARPTSALPLKLTSVTDEKLVATGQEETKRDLNSRRRCHWQFFPWLLA